MIKYSGIIIDDEEKNINLITHFVSKFIPEIELVGTANSVDSGIEIINLLQPDILFLDIQLNDKNAFNLLDSIDFSEIEIIFITAYNDFAVKAFKYNAIDYIMKPISINDLIKASKKVMQRIDEKNLFNKSIQSSPLSLDTIQESKFISISSVGKIELINKEDIIFCKSEGRYTIFYLKDLTERVASKNLGEYETLLECDIFFRIHHSYIVNISYLKSIYKKTGYWCEMINGIKLPISKRREEVLKNFLKLKNIL